MNLPINAGERPLFAALELLKDIKRDYDLRKNEYETTSSEKIYAYIGQLYALAESIRLRSQLGKRNNSDDLLNILFDLPVFFNTKQTIKWETSKPWSSVDFCHYTSYTISYTQTLDGIAPSEAYQVRQPSKPEQDYMWKCWFEKTDLEEVIETLHFSAKKLLQWENQRRETSSILKNTSIFSETLGFSEESGKYWSIALILGSICDWTFVLKEIQTHNKTQQMSDFVNLTDLFDIWEKAFDLPSQSITDLFKKDSKWVEMNILHETQSLDSQWPQIWQTMTEYNLSLFSHNLLDHAYILNLFARPFHTSPIHLSRFNYIADTPLVKKTLTNHVPVRILVHGVAGSGKKTLISSLLHATQLNGYVANPEKLDERKKENNPTAYINTAHNLVKNMDNAVLIIEEAENLLINISSVNKLFNKTEGTIQFWTVSSLKDIPTDIINKFNFFLDVKTIPLEQRIEIADNYFNNLNLSMKVAQAIKTPQILIQLFSWCDATHDKSWSNVKSFLSSFSKAHALSKSLEVLLKPVDNSHNIPALAGYPELDDLMKDLTHLFNHPEYYNKLGAKAPKGVLLVGPPGTGKTHFAKHLSKNVGIPMFAPDTSYLASNPQLIETVFLEAQRHSPCILFFDEIDSLITNPLEHGIANPEKQKVVNTFLSQLEGISSNEGVLVVGATHRYNNLDPAALRSGRLGEKRRLGMPHQDSREAIFKAHLVGRPVDNIKVDLLAKSTKGFSGAEIAEVINQAAVYAAQKQQDVIKMKDFYLACDNVFWGTTDSSIKPNFEEQLRTARHEAGHALLTWKHKLQVNRITLRPRSEFLGGVNWQADEGIYGADMLSITQQIEMFLGGIAAEKVFYEHYSNGGRGDLGSAKKIIHSALLQSGLGSLGPISASDINMWSDSFKQKLEEEESKIMHAAFENSFNWLNTHKNLVDELAQDLLKHKDMSGEELIPWKDKVDDIVDQNLIPSSKGYIEQHTLHKDCD